MWIKENRAVELYLHGEELLHYPKIPVRFAGLVTDTHHLGEFGWRLTMRQRTPLHVRLTRPHIVLSPGSKLDFGFRYRLRAREPYRNEAEVFEDMKMFSGSIVKFSISKFETKEVPVVDRALVKQAEELKKEMEEFRRTCGQLQIQKQDLQAERALLETQNRNLEVALEKAQRDLDAALTRVNAEVAPIDPFQALARWNEEQISRMDFSAPTPPHEPVSNIVDLVEIIRQRETVDMDEDLEERMLSVLGTA